MAYAYSGVIPLSPPAARYYTPPARGCRVHPMPTRITVKGQVTLPKRIREVLRLSPGDYLEFDVTTRGEILVRKAQELPPRSAGSRARRVHPRVAAQMRRRAAELLALLRGLD